MRARSRDPPRAVTSFVAWRCKHSRLSFKREIFSFSLSFERKIDRKKTDNPNEGCEEDRVPTCTSGACFRPACVLFEWFFGVFSPRIYKVTKQHVPRTRLARVSRSETEKNVRRPLLSSRRPSWHLAPPPFQQAQAPTAGLGIGAGRH